MRAFFLIFGFFILRAYAGETYFITHAQTDYDELKKLMAPMTKILNASKSLDKQIIYLQNNKEHWYVSRKENLKDNIEEYYSQYGEHNISPRFKNVYLMGAQLGACLQYTLVDLLKNNTHPLLNIKIDSTSVLSIEGNTLSEILEKKSDNEIERTIHHYFSRMIFLDSSINSKQLKINIFYKNKLLGSLKDQAIENPFKKPVVQIHIDG